MKNRRSTPFILLASPRTGSTWVVTLLDSHSRMAASGELFGAGAGERPPFGAPDMVNFAAYSASQTGVRRRRPFRTFAYLNAVFGRRQDVAAVGFKLMYGHLLRCPEILAYCLVRRVKIVHLVRENLLDVVISNETSRARGFAHATKGSEVQPLSIRLDERRLMRELRERHFEVAVGRRMLRLLGLPHREITYEHLRSDPSSLAPVIEWLGVPAESAPALSSPLVKINADRSQVVSNYDAICRRLRGTRYGRYVSG